MTKTYIYKGQYLTETGWEEVTLIKRVTDKMEERPAWKAGYAARYFNQIMKERYGMGCGKSRVRATQVKEIAE